jgi:Fe-S cluster biogenesis protein NfuA
MMENNTFREQTERIETLVQRVRDLPDENVRQTAMDLLQGVMDIHASVLERIMELTSQAGEAGDALLQNFGNDPMISGLLVLYDLHPDDVETRVLRALDNVRPLLKSKGAVVELISFQQGVVDLRLTGSTHGCASTMATLKTAVEQALYEAAPEVSAIHIEDPSQMQPASGFVPLAKLAISS